MLTMELPLLELFSSSFQFLILFKLLKPPHMSYSTVSAFYQKTYLEVKSFWLSIVIWNCLTFLLMNRKDFLQSSNSMCSNPQGWPPPPSIPTLWFCFSVRRPLPPRETPVGVVPIKSLHFWPQEEVAKVSNSKILFFIF